MFNGLLVRFLVVALLLGVSAVARSAHAAPPVEDSWRANGDTPYATTHIIVKLRSDLVDLVDLPAESTKPQASSKNNERKTASRATPPAAASQAFHREWNRWGVRRMRPAFGDNFGDRESAGRNGLDRTFILEVPQGTDAWEMADAIAALGGDVESAQIDSFGGVSQVLPDDDQFWRQYGLHNTGQTSGTDDADIDAPEAWKLHTGNVGTVTVAIIDSGISPHPEFGDRLISGINTATGYPPGTGDPSDLTIDECPHGTHVAGIVAATGNNQIGIAGVTWGANLMPVRVLGDGTPCGGYESWAAAGIIWAVDNGADILNISLQYCGTTDYLVDAVNYAHDQGVLVISAAGNRDFLSYCDHTSPVVLFPAAYTNSMAISATTDDDLAASFSNYGNEVDVCAPGAYIRSTYPGPPYLWYSYESGTSMATPFVSGLAALIKSRVPKLTHDEIRAIISGTTDDLGPAGWDVRYGYGRINAFDAMMTAIGLQILDSSPPTGAIDARQPSDPDGSNEAGWQWFDVTFSYDTSELTETDFTVTQAGGNIAGATSVIAVIPLGGNGARIILDSKIVPGAWTTITHIDSGTTIRVGFLPGDINGDAISDADDLLTLIDALNGAIDPLPIWSTDVDRSGRNTPADLLRAIDLLNGGDEYDQFLGTSLPGA